MPVIVIPHQFKTRGNGAFRYLQPKTPAGGRNAYFLDRPGWMVRPQTIGDASTYPSQAAQGHRVKAAIHCQTLGSSRSSRPAASSLRK
jgi:hypothetical protein